MFRNNHGSNSNETTMVIFHITRGVLESQLHIFRALLFPALLCCLLWLLSTIVDEVDEMLGVGPEIFEDLEDFVKTGKQPFDHDEPFFIIIAFSLFHRVHDIHILNGNLARLASVAYSID